MSGIAAFKILYVGDSLTWGYYGANSVIQQHPYKKRFEQLLLEHHDLVLEVGHIESELRALPGATTDAVEFELDSALEEAALSATPFDMVVLLVGTNDLAFALPEGSVPEERGKSKTPTRIALDIRNLHKKIHTHGAELVAVTIPDANITSNAYRFKRRSINESIRNYAASSLKTDFSVHLLDLEMKIPYNESNSNLWDDDLHFTPKGYDQIGEHLFEVVRDNQVLEKIISKKESLNRETCSIH